MKHVGWIISWIGAMLMACAKEWVIANFLLSSCILNYLIARDDK